VIAFATHNNGPGPVIVDAEVLESQAALWTNKRCPVAKFTLGSFARASVVVNDRFFRHVGTPARAAQLTHRKPTRSASRTARDHIGKATLEQTTLSQILRRGGQFRQCRRIRIDKGLGTHRGATRRRAAIAHSETDEKRQSLI